VKKYSSGSRVLLRSAARRTFSRLRIVSARVNPAALSPVLSSANAASRCAGFISLSGSPLRWRGMKCQLKRSSESNGNCTLASWSVSSVARKFEAARAIATSGRACSATCALSPSASMRNVSAVSFVFIVDSPTATTAGFTVFS
jgi:hypothetical protein